MEKKQRLVGPDIIRAIAIFLVFSVHMVAISGANKSDVPDIKWMMGTFTRFASLASVPLFLLLTGYFQNRKKLSTKHYLSGIPLLVTYFIIAALIAVVQGKTVGLPNGVAHTVVNIFDFTYGYGWYVEIYLCLFALLPFFNMLIEALDRKKFQLLIGILIGITILPNFVANLLVEGVWLQIVPDFLKDMYVITYYFLGAYIARYQPQVNRWLCVGLGMAVVAAETGVSYLLHGWKYNWHLFSEFSDLPHLMVVLCVFLCFYRAAPKNKALCTVAREISTCSFEMYLLSYFTDHVLYTMLPLPAWQVLLINFAATYVLARLLRFVTVPLGQLLCNSAEKLCRRS